MMESWGRGIGLIVESCREQGLPEPEMRVFAPFVNLTIWYKCPLAKVVDGQAAQANHVNIPSRISGGDVFIPR